VGKAPRRVSEGSDYLFKDAERNVVADCRHLSSAKRSFKLTRISKGKVAGPGGRNDMRCQFATPLWRAQGMAVRTAFELGWSFKKGQK